MTWRFWFLICSLVFSLCEATHGVEVPACRVAIPDAAGNGTSYGSGVLVATSDDASYVLTNAHVVSDGNGKARLEFPDQTKAGRVIAANKRWDVAIIETDRMQIAPVAISEAPIRSGQPASCGGFGPQGEWRGLDCKVANFFAPAQGDSDYSMFEMVGGEVRRGDSGGPICNAKGELIGVVWGASHGTTFGTPVTKAVELCQQYGVCIGGNCPQRIDVINRPLGGQRVIVQQPAKPAPKPMVPVDKPVAVGCQCSGEVARLKSELAELSVRLDSLTKTPGPAGKDGRDGKDCEPLDVDAIAAAVIRKLPPIHVQNFSRDGKLIDEEWYPQGTPIKLRHGVPSKVK